MRKEGLEVLRPDLEVQPRVYYKNLYRHTQCFIGGTVLSDINGSEECVADAEVAVFLDGEELGTTKTDAFGEFKVDRLEQNSGDYDVRVSHPEFGAATAVTTLGESQYIGLIKLT